MTDNLSTIDEIKKLVDKFNLKSDLFKFLNINLLDLYKIIISILNNNQNNFLNHIIGNEEFNKNLFEINDLYNKYNKISSNLNYDSFNEIKFFNIKLNLSMLEDEIKILCLKYSSSFIKEILNLFFKGYYNDIKSNELEIIDAYNDIFTPYSCIIENKDKYLSSVIDKPNGYLFLNKLSHVKENITQEIHGCKLLIFINNNVICFSGHIKNDNINILRRNKFFIDKSKEVINLLKLENISSNFKEKYLDQLSLRDFLLFTPEQLKNIIINAHTKQNYYKKLSLSSLLFTFSNGNFQKQREILTILTLSDSRSAGLASLLYDVLIKKDEPEKAKKLYLSLHISIQKLFDIAFEDFNKEVSKLKNITEQDISYDKRVMMMNIDENTKIKAMEKVKNLNGGMFGSSDNKSQQWIDGFLKIPFGIYKENNIFKFKVDFIEKIKIFINLIMEKNKPLFKEINKYDIPNTDILIDNHIKMFDNLLNNSTKYNCKNLENQQLLIKSFNLLLKDWNKFKIDRKSYIIDVRKNLDKSVYGNNEGKKQIECLIGEWINGKSNGMVLGFQGPPGVGKTTLAKKGLCKCLNDGQENRPFSFISLGGSTNGSTLEGHNYTYVGSTWGKIAEILMDSKCMNPIIFFDELDKISNTDHGKEIIGILTHLTDGTQNDTFNDKYFSGINIDISKALIIFSYNDSSLIDRILKDRITEIKINPLTLKDKLNICRDYLFPEILNNLGYNCGDLFIDESDLIFIIDTYTYEAGVRKIKEKLIEIFRNVNLERLNGADIKIPYKITRAKIESILYKNPKIIPKKIYPKPNIGLVNGLYATSIGIGGLTIIETTKTHSESKFTLELTGQQGDVMKESIKCAKTIAWNLLPNNIKKEINDDWKENGSWGLHIHTPEAATPKDGPSAGGAITLSIISQLCNIPVKNNVAMTGEIDLSGNIRQIGGLLSKLNGAKKAGINLTLIPNENKDDLELIRKDNLSPECSNFKVKLINNIHDILKESLVKNDIKFIKN